MVENVGRGYCEESNMSCPIEEMICTNEARGREGSKIIMQCGSFK